MNWDELRQVWSIPEPWSVRPIAQGDNNLTQVIETPLGSYVLRTYGSERSLERIRYELTVLSTLQQKQQKTLPFRVPVPVPTVTDELFAVLAGTVVTLSPWLSGSPPQTENLEQTYAAGQALAELVKALYEVAVEITPQVAPFPRFGDFEGWSGNVIDSVQIIQKLPITHENQQQALALLQETLASAPTLYQTLPQQIVHRDYDQSNILVESNHVTAVLDFEFCGRDLRIADLAYALSQWPNGLWNTGKEWAVIDAFGQGYLDRQTPTSQELEMLPLLFRLRATTSLLYRLGRYAQGLETQEDILQRIQDTLDAENWLQMNTEALLRHAHGWQH